MAIPDHIRTTIAEFFDAIEPLMDAYRDGSFTYVAVKHEGQFVLLQGYLYLSASPNIPYSHFISENVRVGHYRLSELKTTALALIELILSGEINTPAGKLLFRSPRGGSNYLASYSPFHPVGLQAQNRLNVLRLTGDDQFQYLRQPFLDWELKAAATPYDGLQELMAEYSLGRLEGHGSFVDVVAAHVAAIDFASQIQHNKANVLVRLVNGLAASKFSLGYCVLSQGKIVTRARLYGDAFHWDSTPDVQRGSLEIDVPEAAVVQCIASYHGIAQHFFWLSDPTTVLNSRRAAYEVFDSKLAVLKEIVDKTSGRGQNARDLESAVAWILWMLGFSVVHFGNTRRMEDAADLLATTPTGHVAVIECTTGLLKAENKLSLLHDRAQAVRRGLDASGNQHVRVLTAIVTSQPRADIAVDTEQAEKLGILVLARENLEEMISRTLFVPNSDQLYQEAEQTVKFAQAKHQDQGVLPILDGSQTI